jgi:hypothetical protein
VRLLAVILLLAAATPTMLAAFPSSAAAEATVYRADRPGFHLKVRIAGNVVRAYSVRVLTKCADGRTEISDEGLYGSGVAIPIRPGGFFRLREHSPFDYAFFDLRGRRSGGSITGEYRSWSQSVSEDEGFGPRCGTLTPRGRYVHFVARRVD